MIFGMIGGARTPVVLLAGRAQSVVTLNTDCSLGQTLTKERSFYEGHTMDLVTFATRVCKVLGVEIIIGLFSSRRGAESSNSF